MCILSTFIHKSNCITSFFYPLREHNESVICRAILCTEFTSKRIYTLVVSYERKQVWIVNKWLSTKRRIRNFQIIHWLIIHAIKRQIWSHALVWKFFLCNIELPTIKLVTRFCRISFRELNNVVFYTKTFKNIVTVIFELPIAIRLILVINLRLSIWKTLSCYILILGINNFQDI